MSRFKIPGQAIDVVSSCSYAIRSYEGTLFFLHDFHLLPYLPLLKEAQLYQTGLNIRQLKVPTDFMNVEVRHVLHFMNRD